MQQNQEHALTLYLELTGSACREDYKPILELILIGRENVQQSSACEDCDWAGLFSSDEYFMYLMILSSVSS